MNNRYGTEWRVPTRDEFKQIFNKLYLTGITKVDCIDYYWTDNDFTFDIIIEEGIIWDTVRKHTDCWLFQFIYPDSYDEDKLGWVQYSSSGNGFTYEDVNSGRLAYVRPMRKF